MARFARLTVLLAAVLPGLAGCRAIGALGVLTAPRQMQKAEFNLTKQRLAIVIDYARPGQENPIFDVNLCQKITEYLRDNKVPSTVVPYDQFAQLRSVPDYAGLSIQAIGRRLGADQVLHVRIEDLRLRSMPGDAVLTPSVALNVKVIGVTESGELSRLWPDRDAEPDGRRLTHSRSPVEAETASAVDSEVAKLARETAYYVARHFYKYDLEVLPPHEP